MPFNNVGCLLGDKKFNSDVATKVNSLGSWTSHADYDGIWSYSMRALPWPVNRLINSKKMDVKGWRSKTAIVGSYQFQFSYFRQPCTNTIPVLAACGPAISWVLHPVYRVHEVHGRLYRTERTFSCVSNYFLTRPPCTRCIINPLIDEPMNFGFSSAIYNTTVLCTRSRCNVVTPGCGIRTRHPGSDAGRLLAASFLSNRGW